MSFSGIWHDRSVPTTKAYCPLGKMYIRNKMCSLVFKLVVWNATTTYRNRRIQVCLHKPLMPDLRIRSYASVLMCFNEVWIISGQAVETLFQTYKQMSTTVIDKVKLKSVICSKLKYSVNI